MSELKRIEGVGEASLFRGDPRLPDNSMDKWYNELLFERGPAKARVHFYGADAGLCARRNVLLAHNEWIASEKTPTTRAYMDIGVALEGMLVKALERGGRLVASQVALPLMQEVRVNGYIDIVIFDSEDELALVEVKTCGKLPDAISPTHLAQIQFYSAASGVDKAWVTYISRNVREEFGSGLAIRTFPVDCSSEALARRFLVAAASKLATEAKRLPPVPATFRKHTECHYCEFRDLACWRERPGLGGRLPTPPLPEMHPAEVIRLEASALPLAASMASGRPLRYIEMLKAWGDESKSLDLKMRLKELWENAKREFLELET